ncbi:hypothetical protein KP509_21G038200 [Ceratopteris richardii]|uniref:IF140/IFT172/WDR19 TPR domain-containing protein n=1 Tax=Ceratopteris richardii TaxID=49495 RepID=A0A8T2SCE2_CERRI|nr:hypothetical protein KP509_21G038200 [Ceratopteris richardii]
MLVKDILRDEIIDTIGHSSDVVWLQLNHHADYLLFCDKARELYIFGLGENKCSRLLNICNYVQWVPETNVIIAQSQWTLYIWYSIHNLQHATKFSLKGDLEGVRRSQGHTEVLVCEGSSTVSYELDEALIEVGLSLERSDVDYAFSALEALDMTFETRFMWKQLGDISLKEAKLFYAQCSYACSGDVYRSHYLQKINKAMRAFSDDTVPKQREQCLVQARLQVISKKWKDVETTLLEHGYIEDAMKLYIDAFRFSKAYLEWLMETGQFEDVGKQYVIAGDLKQAIFFLLLGNLPGHAADHAVKLFNESHKGVFMEKIIHILSNRGMTEKLGEVMERLDNYDAAQHAYKEVHSFHRAVQLAQIFSKQDVMKLEEEWGDYLVSQNEMEEAIPHYLESGSFRKYVQAAAAAHQWNKAIQITMQQKTEVIKPIYTTLAREFEKIKQLAKAEKMFINAELPNEAVIMYLKANKLEAAQKVASQFLSLDEADKIFFRQAKDFESSRRFKDAEKLYLELGQHDAAINMYKAQGMFDNVIQLVSQFRKDGLHETLLYLAEELERKGMLRDAEHHYLELENWKHVVKMYTASAMWEDAMRVARSWGDISAVNEVAYAWAIAVKGTREIETLIKLGFLDQAIDHAVSVGAFNDALQMCTEGSVEKLKEVQSKFAKFLECQGRVAEAEDIYIKAGKPVDAIKMYTAKNEWKDAVRVADLFHPSALTDILVSQAHFLAETNELKKAEALFIQAKRPDLIIHTYKTKNLWDDAIRVAQKLMPDALHEIQHEFTCFVQRKSNNVETLDSIMMDGMTAESKQDFQKAIDIYIMMDLKSLPDMEKLRMVWYRAIELAQEHAKNRIPEVVHAVANQLVKAGQYQEAAHLYLEKRHYEEAVEIFVFDGQWEKAREVAERSGQEKLTKYIEKQYTELLLKNGEAGMPVSMGGVHKTLNICSEKEDWDKVHELSISMGPRAQKECSAHHISHCLQNSQILEAISVVKRYGLPHTLEGCDLCHQLASQLLLSYGSGQISSVVIQDFRNFLHTYLQDGRGSISSEMKSVFEDLEAVLIPLTYIVLHSLYLQQGMKEFAAKVSVSLLRFIQSLLPDLAFFYAGVSCKEAGWYDKAFVFFNQYLDIAETIDDKETSIVLDHPTFNSSDIPQVLTIPKGHSINSDKQQEIQDWVIQYSVNRQEDKTSMIRECTNCQSSIFEASLCCPSCKALSKACCVTGYPLDEYGKTECPYCHMPANTSDWKSFLEVFHICPWCNMHMDGSHM